MTASKHAIASDLAKVDAYENTAADYEEIPEVTDEEFARAIPHRNGVPVRDRSSMGGGSKQSVTLRLDPEIIEHYRALGPDWQGRINETLAKAIGARTEGRTAKKGGAT